MIPAVRQTVVRVNCYPTKDACPDDRVRHGGGRRRFDGGRGADGRHGFVRATASDTDSAKKNPNSTERWLTIDAPKPHERPPMGRERDDGEWIVTVLIALLAVALIFFLVLR
jgi:2-polyprenyl-6-methoxyphenol hydroxylase-like FAD-dependent oxidoreductase